MNGERAAVYHLKAVVRALRREGGAVAVQRNALKGKVAAVHQHQRLAAHVQGVIGNIGLHGNAVNRDHFAGGHAVFVHGGHGISVKAPYLGTGNGNGVYDIDLLIRRGVGV